MQTVWQLRALRILKCVTCAAYLCAIYVENPSAAELDSSLIQEYLQQRNSTITSDWIRMNLVYENTSQERLRALVQVFRYFENIEESALGEIEEIWKERSLFTAINDFGLQNHVQLALASVLARHSNEPQNIYKDYIQEKTYDDSVAVRTLSYLILGDVASNDDIEFIAKGFSDENAAPAIQAGNALLIIGTSEAVNELKAQLAKLIYSSSDRDIEVFDALTIAINDWCEVTDSDYCADLP